MSNVISDIGRSHLLWALTDGVGPIIFTRLIQRFGDAHSAAQATAGDLQQVHGISRARADQFTHARDDVAVAVEDEIAAADENGVRIISRADPEYPPGLQQIPDAPIVLYIKGEYRDTDTIAIAIVGTRRCSIYGSEQAHRFGELLAGAGFTVVSGLARGIDAFAHHGAVDAGGRSIAVFGNGLTEIYPPENRALAEKLIERGAWISELPMRAAVRRENFPNRNRIIAGITLGTLVIEAPMRSGALITARLANDYNREVFALPGRIQEPASIGTNAFIRDGIAKLVTNLDDILDELGDLGERMSHAADTPTTSTQQSTASERSAPASLSPLEQRVYKATSFEPVLQDVVIRAADLPAGEVLATLTTLELKGLIQRLPGNLVVRRGKA
ncbi:MAG: DNA-processing protein DprA [Planctomycetota bacterium]